MIVDTPSNEFSYLSVSSYTRCKVYYREMTFSDSHSLKVKTAKCLCCFRTDRIETLYGNCYGIKADRLVKNLI